MKYVPILALLAVMFIGCEDSSDPDDTTAAVEDTVPADEDTARTGKAFGEPCGTAADCASSVCHEFGTGGSLCTIECTSPDDCPEGSEGKKCNGKGACKP